MTCPTAPPISLWNLQAEFGGAAPTSLWEYFAGNGLVPAGARGQNGPIPAGGSISLWHFFGASAYLDQQNMVAAFAGAPYNTTGYLRNICGSLSDGTFNLYNTNINQLEHNGSALAFVIDGANLPNSGWTQMEIVGIMFVRRDSAYSFYSNPAEVVGPTTGWFFTTTQPFVNGGSYTIKFYY